MIVGLRDWRLDLLFMVALLGFLVSAALFYRMERDRQGIPPGKLTRMEQLSITLQSRGDLFRLAQSGAGLVFMVALMFVPGSHATWLLVCFGFLLGTIPLHSTILLLGARRGLRTVPGSSVERDAR